jgi:hypothetical protein
MLTSEASLYGLRTRHCQSVISQKVQLWMQPRSHLPLLIRKPLDF